MVNSNAYLIFNISSLPHPFQFSNHIASLLTFCIELNIESVPAASQSGLILIIAKRDPSLTEERSEQYYYVDFRLFPVTCFGVFF